VFGEKADDDIFLISQKMLNNCEDFFFLFLPDRAKDYKGAG